MTIKLKKCHFFRDSIEYLRHVIAPGKRMGARKTTEAIAALHYPTTVSQMGSFLRLCDVYILFVLRFAKIAAPLNQRLKNGEPQDLELNERKREAADNLKSKITYPPVLVLPKATGQFVVNPDASEAQLVFVLHQGQEDEQLGKVHWLLVKVVEQCEAELRHDTQGESYGRLVGSYFTSLLGRTSLRRADGPSTWWSVRTTK